MMQKIGVFLLIWLFPAFFLYSETGEKTLEEKQRDIIRYGTETEIANLIATLKNEKATYLNDELAQIAKDSKNVKIITGVFTFFTEQNRSGLESKAIELIQNRYDEQKEAVRSAIEYVGAVKAKDSIKYLQDILNTDDKSFLNSAIRALGKIIGSLPEDKKKDIADYLMNYYKTKEPVDDDKNAIIFALGESGLEDTIDFIADIATNPDERPFRKMTALEALGKIKDKKGLNAIFKGSQDTDPNVRASAIAALGPFSGEKVDEAIIGAFRDSFYKTRLAAAKAAGERKLAAAVPYLRFRAANDEVVAVKEASVRALGQIGNTEAVAALLDLFRQKNIQDQIKIVTAEMLLTHDAEKYGQEIIKSYQDAKQQKQKVLQAGLAKVLSDAKAHSLKSLARDLLASTDIVELSYGLQLAKNNNFTDLADMIKPLRDEKKYGSLARRAKETLETFGIRD